MIARPRAELIKKWSELKDKNGNLSPFSVADIKDHYVKGNVAQLLENTMTDYGLIEEDINMLLEASQADTTLSNVGGKIDGSADAAAYKWQPIVLALVRRAMPELFAHKVVGVQSMNAPVGLAYAIRKIYTSGNTEENEAGWEAPDYFGGYTGNQSQTSGVLSQEQSGIYDTSAAGIAATSAETWTIGPSGTWPQLKIKIDKKTIEAVSRKLATSYSLESAQDLKAMLGVEIEREMVDFIQYELVAELDRELVYRIKKAATTASLGGEVLSSIDCSGTALDGRWSQEKFSNIINAIIQQSNRIATLTRQGAGNFAIVSPAIATVLQGAPTQWFNKNTSDVDVQKAGIADIGSINGNSIKIYRDSYARVSYALVGYKGPTPKEAGVIYCPYLLGLTQRAIDPSDFSPRIGTIMRYAIVDNMLGSGRYYRLLHFSNIGQIVPGATI